MRNDYALMSETIRRFTDATPTADAAATSRQCPPPAVLERIEIPELQPAAGGSGQDLRQTLQRRSSSLNYKDENIHILPRLAELRAALRRDATDWGSTAAAMPLEGYVFAFRSADLPPAIYRVDTEGAARVGQLPPQEHWADLGVQKEFSDAAAIVSAAANLDAADTWGGTHGYRLAMTRSASAIYDFHLQFVSRGLVGTVFAGFIPAAVRHSLASDGASRQQMFATTVAVPAPWA